MLLEGKQGLSVGSGEIFNEKIETFCSGPQLNECELCSRLVKAIFCDFCLETVSTQQVSVPNRRVDLFITKNINIFKLS